MSRQGEQRYQAFHGRPVQRRGKLRVRNINEVICLGDAVEIVYRSNKLNGGGDGRFAEYVHKFSRGAKLYCTPDGREILLIHSPRIRVSNPGIIH